MNEKHQILREMINLNHLMGHILYKICWYIIKNLKSDSVSINKSSAPKFVIVKVSQDLKLM